MSDYSPDHWLKDQMRDETQPANPKFLWRNTPNSSGGRDIGFVEYQPTYCAVEKQLLHDCIQALESGLENTQHCLIEHDSSLGRATIKNESTARLYEKEIRIAEKCLKGLREIYVGAETHYP